LGFSYFSLSDVIRNEADKLGMQKTRENLIALGNKLRENYGNGVLAQAIKEAIPQNKDVIIDSIRNPEEVDELRKLQGFLLVGVDASEKIRFERMLARNRKGDPKTLEEFKTINEDLAIEHGQKVQSCMKMADCIIMNDAVKEQLHSKISKLLKDFGGIVGKARMSKDEYYLSIADAVSRRATCLRRCYGAIIVKNDHIISTGYCGAPRNMENCSDKGYCKREELNIPSGERYELCRSVHAEANALINAARAGVSVLGGKLYLAGFDAKNGETIPASPCKMCTRLIINAGIKEVAVKEKEGYNTYDVSSWVSDSEGRI